LGSLKAFQIHTTRDR